MLLIIVADNIQREALKHFMVRYLTLQADTNALYLAQGSVEELDIRNKYFCLGPIPGIIQSQG